MQGLPSLLTWSRRRLRRGYFRPGDGGDLAPELTGTINQIVTIRLVGIAGPHHRFEGHRLYQIVGHRGSAFVRPEHDFDLLD